MHLRPCYKNHQKNIKHFFNLHIFSSLLYLIDGHSPYYANITPFLRKGNKKGQTRKKLSQYIPILIGKVLLQVKYWLKGKRKWIYTRDIERIFDNRENFTEENT